MQPTSPLTPSLTAPLQIHYDDFLPAMKRWPSQSVNAIISDPPYATTNLKWDKPVDWPAFWGEAERVITPNALIVMFSAQPFTTTLINSKPDWFRYEIIWEKNIATGWLDAKKRPLRAHENILIFAPKFRGTIFNPQKTPGKPYTSTHGTHECQHYTTKSRTQTVNLTGERNPRSVIRFSNARGSKSLHPTQKPVDMMTYLVRTYTEPGDTIYDPFMGSGSTGVAALLEGRRFGGSEREFDYFKTAAMRLHEVIPLAILGAK